MAIHSTVVDVRSERPEGRLIIVPSIAMRGGRVVRPSPFSSADAVFMGTAADVARRFLAHTPARTFHLFDVDGAAASETSIAAAVEARALGQGDVTVLLEGGLADLDACLRVADRGILPVADEAILAEARDPAIDGELPYDVLFGLRGDDDEAFKRVAGSLERGLWGVVHHSSDPGVSCKLSRRIGGHMPFYSRAPMACPDDVEEVIDHHRRLFRGGVPAVIVDGEWYVDYNTMDEAFDLMR